MIRTIRIALVAVLAMAAASVNAQSCNVTLNPGADISAAVSAASAGQTICLNAGTYPQSASVFNDGSISIFKSVTVRGLGATPASVVLQGGASVDYAVKFVNVFAGGDASGAQLINLTIQGSRGGVIVYNFFPNAPARLTDIKLKDVVITTLANGDQNGVLLRDADRIVLDNVTITSNQGAVNFLTTTDSMLMNSNVVSTGAEGAVGVALIGGSGNRVINNTIGRPKQGTSFAFNGDALVVYNSSDNRIENNLVQGMRDGSITTTAIERGVPAAPSLNNYIGKNVITHTAFSEGQVLNSAGVWTNCASHGAWVYGNNSRGVAECAICVWQSSSNMLLANNNSSSGIVGTAISGGAETLGDCTANGSAFLSNPPSSNFMQSNANFFNRNDQVVIRNVSTTEATRNFASPNDGFGGPAQSCNDLGVGSTQCQSAFSVETDTSPRAPTTGVRLLANTNVGNNRNLQADSTSTTGIEYYLNRVINSPTSRHAVTGPRTFDRGATLGGNYWSQFTASGNPSSGTPFSGVFDSLSNTTGNVVDRFPYRSENLGRGYNITVFEPAAGTRAARGSKRTVRWDSVGCSWVDIDWLGTTLVSAAPNTGYAIVTIPANATIGSGSLTLRCRDGAGTIRGNAASSATFFVTDATLNLVSPGRDEVFNAGQSIWVSWKNTAPATNTSVAIDYAADGSNFSQTLATVTGISADNPVSSTRVTLPATITAYGAIRIRFGGSAGSPGNTSDQTDGVFAARGGSGGFTNTNVFPGRIYNMGQLERIEWTSPQNSRFVTINATVGSTTINVATNLPDRGYFDWVMPDLGPGALTLAITYRATLGGAPIGATVTNAVAGNTRYPTTITFGAPPTVAPGGSAPITVTTNSPQAASLTSSTPSVCTVSGFTVNGVANGTCTLTANAATNGNFTAALPSVISFSVGQQQTITFTNPGGFIAIGGTLNLSATASSGLPVVFSSLTQSVCTVSGSVLTGANPGTCIVAANQPGNGTIAAAQEVQRMLQAVSAGVIPRLGNISTRGQVLTNNDVMIGGFIIGGNLPKTVVVRARGPSLIPFGIPNALTNPNLDLFAGQTLIDTNDNWQGHSNVGALQTSGLQPTNAFESAIYTTLTPGAYTAIVSGVGGGTGVGIVEVFEVDRPEVPLLNISTRGQVQTGNDVMIGGFIIQGTSPQTVIVRARGPSLIPFGIPNALANPTFELYSGQTIIATNDDWQSHSSQAAVAASGLAPTNPLESALQITLQPGPYTVVVKGVGNGVGVGIVEVFAQ